MYLKQYEIKGTVNNDQNPCFSNPNTFPTFQEELERFKVVMMELAHNGASVTIYKYGDGDYYFLKQQSVGSATPGKRALSKSYNDIFIIKRGRQSFSRKRMS